MINELSRNPLFFLRYSPPEPSRISHTPHSHSIVPRHSKALIFQRKFFLHTTKNRPSDPSKIHALDFKGEFQRSAICPASATISIYWSIFVCSPPTKRRLCFPENTVMTAPITRACRRTIGAHAPLPGKAKVSSAQKAEVRSQLTTGQIAVGAARAPKSAADTRALERNIRKHARW